MLVLLWLNGTLFHADLRHIHQKFQRGHRLALMRLTIGHPARLAGVT